MNPSKTFKTLTAIAFLSGTALSGCIVAPAPGYYGGGYNSGYVAVAPPTPQVEVVGVAPTPGFLWFPGFWGWEGGRHVWHGGYWGPGRAGYRWAPHTWSHYNAGWRMSPGHWVRR